VKSSYFADDNSMDLLEWLLISREQGYGKVYFHFFKGMHANVDKVVR